MPLSSAGSFTTLGPTYFVAATSTQANVIVGNNTNSVMNIAVENLDQTNDIFVNWSRNGASVTATAPTAGNPQPGVCIQQASTKIINIANNSFVANANIAVVTMIPGTAANVTITVVA